jgi:nucleotide-binding universal stress UspA family protein
MTENYQLVVGVDGSDGGHRALRWAVREATARGGSVQAVLAWRWDGIETLPPMAPNPADQRDIAARILAREVGRLPDEEQAGVTIATEVVQGPAAEVLTTAARGADLLVLGSHGHGRIHHTVLGSVSEECARKATCPVVVVPVPPTAPQPSVPARAG